MKFCLAVNGVFFDETLKSTSKKIVNRRKKNFRDLDILRRKNVGKAAFFLAKSTAQSEAEGRTVGRRLSTKTSPKGEFECLEATSTKCE